MITVLLVDDHRVVLAGLASLVGAEPDMEVVAVADNADEAYDLAVSTSPDVVLMDLSMPGTGGVEATRRILSAKPATRVLVLTSFWDRDRILDAVQAGAAGYLLKDCDPEDLLRGIRAAAQGDSPLDPRVAREVLHGRRTGTFSSASDLTGRERETLVLVAQGLTNRAIATRLRISESTVKAHLSSVFQRIGVADRTSAALWARRNLSDLQ